MRVALSLTLICPSLALNAAGCTRGVRSPASWSWVGENPAAPTPARAEADAAGAAAARVAAAGTEAVFCRAAIREDGGFGLG